MLKCERFQIAQIHIPAKHRGRVNPDTVREIAESILENGQQTPIQVRADGERFVLVEGLHRLEACKALGEETIAGFLVQARAPDALSHEGDADAVHLKIEHLLIQPAPSAASRATRGWPHRITFSRHIQKGERNRLPTLMWLRSLRSANSASRSRANIDQTIGRGKLGYFEHGWRHEFLLASSSNSTLSVAVNLMSLLPIRKALRNWGIPPKMNPSGLRARGSDAPSKWLL